jgi:hypothetical protein
VLVNWDKTTRWLTIAANLAVLGGLILVAIQIRQNTAITRAQVANDYFMADMQLELAMMGDNAAASWIKAVYTPDELTPQDAAVVDRYLNYGFVQIQRLERMNELGLADDRWQDRISYLRWHLGNEIGRRWWDHARRFHSAEFGAQVDSVLAQDQAASANRELLDALLHREHR